MPALLNHPFSPKGMLDPYPNLAAYRRVNPAIFDRGMNMWLLTGYEVCRAALRDPAFSAAAGQQQRARDDALPVSMLNTDGDTHQRLRSPAAAAFSARSIDRMSRDFGDLADDLLASIAGRGDTGGADVVADIAQPFAERVLGRALRLEREHWPELGRLSRAAAINLNPMVRGPAAADARRASGELNEFLLRHSRRLRSAEPAQDLAGLPVYADLTESERLGVFSLTIIGGYEPLVVSISTTLHLLLGLVDVVGELRVRPEKMAAAVDEALRLESPIPFTARVCTTGFVGCGTELPAGAVVLAMVGAANRDPAVFADPDRFDLERSPNPHLALGGAAHFCLGAPLVRRSSAVLLNALLQRFPSLRSDPDRAALWRTDLVPRGLARLPVLW